MDQHTVKEYRRLKSAGVDLGKQNVVQPNAGSETYRHLVAKTTAFRVLREHGFRVDSEVELPNGEVDLLGWGQPQRLTYAVEVETSPTEAVMQDKLERYVREVPPIDDLLMVDVSRMPEEIPSALGYVRAELNL